MGPDLMPRVTEGRMVEYGCGHYGCVLPVSEGCVLKITTDHSEAAFVVAAMGFEAWPPGIVQYYAALALPDHYDGRPIYLLWREEAYEVGALTGFTKPERHPRYPYYEREFGREPIANFRSNLRDFQEEADDIFEILINTKDKTGFLEELDEARTRIAAGERWVPVPQDRAQLAAYYAANCARYADAMTRSAFGSSIGEALSFYLDRGMALADVHLGNIGEVRDDPLDADDWDLAIIDPGVMVPLKPERLRVHVPSIGTGR